MSRHKAPSALLVSVLAGSAIAQSPPPQPVTVRLDGDGSYGYHKSEMAMRASKNSFDIMAAWHEHQVPASGSTLGRTSVFYNVSTNGKDFHAIPRVVPLPEEPPSGCWGERQGADPMVAFDPDGVGYVGGNPNFPPGHYDRFWIAKKSAGTSHPWADTATPVLLPFGVYVDKGVLFAGLTATVPHVPVLGLAFGHYIPTVSYDQDPKAVVSPPQFNLCNETVYPTLHAMASEGEHWGNNGSLILNHGDYTGRWVVGQYHPTTGHPHAAYSSDGGYNWLQSTPPTSVRTLDNSGATEALDLDINLAHNGSAVIEPYPLLAAHPRPYLGPTPPPSSSPGTVYMAFVGRTVSDSDPYNLDICIARSTDGGKNFSGDPDQGEQPGQRVWRLSDAELGDVDPDTTHTDRTRVQFFPSIAVDDWGGIHIQYYVGWWCAPPPHGSCSTPHWLYKVKLAYIKSFDDLHQPGCNAVTTVDLTPGAFDLDDISITRYDPGDRRFIGDYMNSLDVRGCQIIAGHINPDPESLIGPVGVYVSFALIPNSVCVPDQGCYANCDGTTVAPLLDVNDFLCFMERYGAGDTWANCDGSTTPPVVNVNDISCFLQRYTVGCG